jgi:diguanylate cyclase (GGDEF)-like protein
MPGKKAEITELDARGGTNFDPVTELPGRALLEDRMRQAMARSARESENFAVLLIDLDRFGTLDETFEDAKGDELLRQFGARLTEYLRETDTVARFGTDEFAILQTDLRDPTHVATLAQKLLDSLSRPFTVGGHDVHTSASIGIAVHDPGVDDVDTLLDRAAQALLQAQEEGGNTYRFHTAARDATARAQVQLSAELHHAIEREDLVLHYQPQIEIESGRTVGLEALVRWEHRERGLIQPDEFIPVAEASGLIVPLGDWALRQACHQARTWLDDGVLPELMAVNVSALQFKDQSLVEQVMDTLAESGLPAERLEIELTESIVMDSMAGYHAILGRLKGHGVSFAIDDFGTGYSSLKYLRTLPVAKLKIDREFVQGAPGDGNDAAIVRAIVDLGHNLGLTVVAEGVETEAQLAFLQGLGCDQAQGDYFSKPLPVDEIDAMLRT